MNKLYTKFLLLLILPLFFFAGCDEDDEVTMTDPSIIFSTSRSSLDSIDLNAGTGPNIIGWAAAPAGLSQVTIIADKKSGSEEILNISSFDANNSEKNGTAYQFNILPNYSPDFTGITVTVIDVNNKSAQIMLDVLAAGGNQGPKMAGFTAGPIEANIRPVVNIRPEIAGTISSHWGLQSVALIEIYGDTEEEVQTITDFGETPNSYAVKYTPDYDKGFAEGLTGFKIIAEDKKGNVNTYNVVISVIDASAAPIVTFDQESIEADLVASPAVEPVISGNIESIEGFSSITFYVVAPGGDEILGEEITTFTDENNYTFSFEAFPYALGVKGLKIVAVDKASQNTTETLPIAVVAEDPNLEAFNNVVVNAQANRNDAGVVTAFSAGGETFTLADGLVAENSEKIDFITADSGGDNGLDLFSPLGSSWLSGNYFEDDDDLPVVWPVLNTTKLLHLEDKDETFFAGATSIDISNLSLGTEFENRIQLKEPDLGAIILFETADGRKGLLHYKAHDPNDAEGSKADKFTFDIKVVK